MKKKISLLCMILIQFCLVSATLSAESSWVKTGENAKTVVHGNKDYANRKLTYEKATEYLMGLASHFPNCSFTVDQYTRSEFSKTSDFSDAYIYGSALDAFKKYGVVEIKYYKYDNEVESITGFDYLYLLKLKDDKVLCARILKPYDGYIAESCILDKDNDCLIMKEKKYGYILTVFLYGNKLNDQGDYYVINSEGKSSLEGTVLMGNEQSYITTNLHVTKNGNTVIIWGNALLYDASSTQIVDSFKFYYNGNLSE